MKILNHSWLMLAGSYISKGSMVQKTNVQARQVLHIETPKYFLKYLLNLMQEEGFTEEQIFNADETRLFNKNAGILGLRKML